MKTDKQRIYALERRVRSLEGLLNVLAGVVQHEREQRQGLRADLKATQSATVELMREHVVQRHPPEDL